MENIGKTFSQTKENNIASQRLSSGKPTLCKTTVLRNTKRTNSNHKTRNIAPNYLIIPAELDSVQERIIDNGDIELICHLLTVLNKIFPLKFKNKKIKHPKDIVEEAFQNWIKSILSSNIYAKIDMSLQIFGQEEVRFSEHNIPNTNAMISFGIPEFIHDYYPLGEALKIYDEQYPGLQKYILKMLSYCPIPIGTPEMIYELASYYCWNCEDNEQLIYAEKWEEYAEYGENEEEARNAIDEMIFVKYEDFKNNLPEWSFNRTQRHGNYDGKLPLEIVNMHHCYKRWKRKKQIHFSYPNYSYPPIIVAFDQKTYNFCCEVVDSIGYDIGECGEFFETTGLFWPIQSTNHRQILIAFLELQYALEYFASCMNFLSLYEKEYPDA